MYVAVLDPDLSLSYWWKRAYSPTLQLVVTFQTFKHINLANGEGVLTLPRFDILATVLCHYTADKFSLPASSQFLPLLATQKVLCRLLCCKHSAISSTVKGWIA